TCPLPVRAIKSMPSGPPQSIVDSIFVCVSCVVEREPAKSPVPTASMIAQATYEPCDVRQGVSVLNRQGCAPWCAAVQEFLYHDPILGCIVPRMPRIGFQETRRMTWRIRAQSRPDLTQRPRCQGKCEGLMQYWPRRAAPCRCWPERRRLVGPSPPVVCAASRLYQMPSDATLRVSCVSIMWAKFVRRRCTAVRP